MSDIWKHLVPIWYLWPDGSWSNQEPPNYGPHLPPLVVTHIDHKTNTITVTSSYKPKR